jgi:nickel/cobalt exporter
MMDKKDKDILKLSKLCKHWADHNESHKESFLKWRNIAEEKSLNVVAKYLDKAIEMLDKCNEFLLAANKKLE